MKYRVTKHACEYDVPKHASSIDCSYIDMVRVLDPAIPVCRQRTHWSGAPEKLEASRDPTAMWLTTTH